MSILRSFGVKAINFTRKAAMYGKVQAEANLALSEAAIKVFEDREITSKFLNSLEELENMVKNRATEIGLMCKNRYGDEIETAMEKYQTFLDLQEDFINNGFNNLDEEDQDQEATRQ